MKSRSLWGGKSLAWRASITGMLAALLLALQVALAALPNIEMVSFLIIVYTFFLRKEALFSIYVFILAEAVIYGPGLWLINYLYMWFVLWAATMILIKIKAFNKWTVVILSSAYGLAYGAFCAVPYLLIGGPSMAFTYWVSGIPFDVLHCIGNAAVAIVCYTPITRLFSTMLKSDKEFRNGR